MLVQFQQAFTAKNVTSIKMLHRLHVGRTGIGQNVMSSYTFKPKYSLLVIPLIL